MTVTSTHTSPPSCSPCNDAVGLHLVDLCSELCGARSLGVCLGAQVSSEEACVGQLCLEALPFDGPDLLAQPARRLGLG